MDWYVVPSLRLSAQVRHHSGYFSDDLETEAGGVAFTGGTETAFAINRALAARAGPIAARR